MSSMQIVQFDDLAWTKLGAHREFQLRVKTLLRGEEGAKDNFRLLFNEATGGKQNGPRHRHNFEQIRIPLTGRVSYGRNRFLETGEIGYFPEGCYYGPTRDDREQGQATIVFQCGGASGIGYPSSIQTKRAHEELSAIGTFRRGMFRWPEQHPVNPGKVQDAFEALWEHLYHRPIEYPTPRYSDQVIMQPASFDWKEDAGRPGMLVKKLGRFTERDFEVDVIRIEAGETTSFAHRDGTQVGFVLNGEALMNGKPLSKYGAFSMSAGITPQIESLSGIEFVLLGLPKFGRQELAAAA